jgi:hypothetical protein
LEEPCHSGQDGREPGLYALELGVLDHRARGREHDWDLQAEEDHRPLRRVRARRLTGHGHMSW